MDEKTVVKKEVKKAVKRAKKKVGKKSKKKVDIVEKTPDPARVAAQKGDLETRAKLIQTSNDLYQMFQANPMAWGFYYFVHHFRNTSPYFHKIIINKALNSLKFAIQCPRGSAKSTVLCFLYIIWCIAFKRKRHIIILQNTLNKAKGSLHTIKSEFKDNNRLMKDFKITISRDSSEDSIFEHADGFKIRVLCKGEEQMGTIRGEKFGAYRPDLIVIDDLEDDDMVRSPERREYLVRKFEDAVIPAGEPGVTQYIVVGTILHDDCLIAKLVSPHYYKEFTKLFFKALYAGPKSGELKSLWPEKWSVEDLQHLEKTKPETFAKEYQGDPVSGALQKFYKEDFRYWRVENGQYILLNTDGSVKEKGILTDCRAAIGCDMAWEESKQSDDTVVMPIYITPNSDILVSKYFCKKGVRPDEFANILFTMETQLRSITNKTVPIGFEKGKIEKINKWFLRQECRRRNHFLLTKDIPWVTDKITRIVTPLQPRYAMNSIYHMNGMGDLESQLMRIPSGNHDDLCLATGTKISTIFGDKNIEDMRVGEWVITPNGLNRVDKVMCNGVKPVINKFGLTITPNHKVFDGVSMFDSVISLCFNSPLSKLTLREMVEWRYRILLYSMERSIKGWVGKENIISISTIQILDERILKDFMWRFGNFIIKKELRKVMQFTMSTITLLIMTFLIFNVYRIANILSCIGKTVVMSIKQGIKNALDRFKIKLNNGMVLKKGFSGIESMGRRRGKTKSINNIPVYSVESYSNLDIQEFQSSVKNSVVLNTISTRETINKKESVLFVNQNTQSTINGLKQERVRENVQVLSDKPLFKETKTMVYNISVEQAHLYYANGVLVGNCDALQMAVRLLEFAPTARKSAIESEDPMFAKLMGLVKKNRKDSKVKPFIFGRKQPVEAIKARESLW